jgi:serine/threonine-protein kinase OSR1/STK39
MRYRQPEGLQEAVVATIMREVLRALAYVHTHGSIHRDVKAGNVLVDGEGRVKLGDFGVSGMS